MSAIGLLYDPAGVRNSCKRETAGAVDDGDGRCAGGGEEERLLKIDIAVLTADGDGMCAGRKAHVARSAACIQQIHHARAVDEDAEGGITVRSIQKAHGGIACGHGDDVVRQRLNGDAAGIAGIHSAAFAGIGQRDDGNIGDAGIAREYSAALARIGKGSDRDVSIVHMLRQRESSPPASFQRDTALYSAEGRRVSFQSASINQYGSS